MKTILLISHSSGIEGPIDYCEDYLLRNGHYSVVKFSHPLDDYQDKKSILTINRKITKEYKRHNFGLVNLFIDFYLSVKIILKYDFDILVGANNFDTLAGISCKKFFKRHIKKIIYFASDFSEERFNNIILDRIYYFVEKVVLKKSDLVISNTKRAEQRRFVLGLSQNKSQVIPNGVYLENPKFEPKTIHKDHFIYVGSVTKEHGLYDILKVICSLIKKFVLIGQGNDWDRVVEFCNNQNFEFEKHYKKDHQFVIDYLQDFGGFGLAPYNLESKWTYYCSPLKVNEYIACGVPVIISDVPEIVNLIEKEKLGISYAEIGLGIRDKINLFNLVDFHKRAKNFYGFYNYDNLLKDIIL